MWYYFCQYILAVVVFNATTLISSLLGGINVLGYIPTMFELGNNFVLAYIPICYLLVKLQIIRKVEIRKDLNYNQIKSKLMIACSIFNILFMYLYDKINNYNGFSPLELTFFVGFTILFIYILNPTNVKDKDIMDNEIKKYYENKK